MDFQSRLLCTGTCMLGKDILRKKMKKNCWFSFFLWKIFVRKNCLDVFEIFLFCFFFLSIRGLEFSLIISIMPMGKIADSLALKCRAVTYNNQIRKKSLCENAVNHIFMFNHLILFKSKSKLSLFQQERPIVTKCFFVGYFGYMWYSITWHKYKLYSIERLNVV